VSAGGLSAEFLQCGIRPYAPDIEASWGQGEEHCSVRVGIVTDDDQEAILHAGVIHPPADSLDRRDRNIRSRGVSLTEFCLFPLPLFGFLPRGSPTLALRLFRGRVAAGLSRGFTTTLARVTFLPQMSRHTFHRIEGQGDRDRPLGDSVRNQERGVKNRVASH
jgi:hypothetical protein